MPANVLVTSAVSTPGSPTSVTVSYTVTVQPADVGTGPATYNAYSTALSASIASGSFASILKSQAKVNTARYLAGASVVPEQALLQLVQTLSPTSTPTYVQASPTPVPTATPTIAPTSSPTLSPTYVSVTSTFVPSTPPGLLLGSSSDLTTLGFGSTAMGGAYVNGGSGSSKSAQAFQQAATSTSAMWLVACQDSGYVKMVQLQVLLTGGNAYAQAVAAGYVASSLSTGSLTQAIVSSLWATSNPAAVATSYSAAGYGVASITATLSGLSLTSAPSAKPTSQPATLNVTQVRFLNIIVA